MRRTKVLLLVENNPYPADFRVRREALALRDAGYEVGVIAPRGAGQPWRETVDGVRVHRFPPPPGGRGALGYAFEFACATLAIAGLTAWVGLRHGVDVVHAANPPDTLCLVGLMARLARRKFVFDHHDLAPEVYLSRFGVRREDLACRALRLLERASYAVANVVIATNESYRQIALARGGKTAERVFVVRNGPPLSYQPLHGECALSGRAAHLIGYVGTIGPQDGVDLWMRALRELVFTLGRRDVLAVVIGDGDALAEARRLAQELKVEPYVNFTGRLSELECRRVLSAADVCVQPDPLSPLNDKSTMNKLMEYMALGKPTVAFDLHETRCSAEEAALYAPPNDVHEFAGRVAWLLDHPEERRRMGEAGRRRVADALAWEHSVPTLLRAYREGLGLPPLHPSKPEPAAPRAPA
jgi:glycosyltransferase involved in cell wall biosynthesis